MKKILFLIHDLGAGGAEKVLVNLVNNLDSSQYDITVMTLFDVGVNRQFLNKNIHYKSCFKHMVRGNSHLMKLLTPKQLHNWLIKDEYDIEIAYLEGPSARVISGCTNPNSKKICWIHRTLTRELFAASFRNYKEAIKSYRCFDKIVCVSNDVKSCFEQTSGISEKTYVAYNTVESEQIREMSLEKPDVDFEKNVFNMIAAGTFKEIKGFNRLLQITKKLVDDKHVVHLYLLGKGELENEYRAFIRDNRLEDYVTLLGYQKNPYKYYAHADLFVCSSFFEGFSTATTEALIVGIPVITTDVSGMREMLGDNNEYGIIVQNNDMALEEGIRDFINNKEKQNYYRKQSVIRGKKFCTQETVEIINKMFQEV